MKNTPSFNPVIIIGAARSGTRLLRELVSLHPMIDHIPYDINYIWRFGNEQCPHDEITPDLLTPAIRDRIREKFREYSTGVPLLVEKTVSNCLRVPFVDMVFPEAKYIHLIRNGEDVVESVYRQWTAPPDWNYIFAKAKTFPILDAFGYAMNYSRRLFFQIVRRNDLHRNTWGPRYEGIDDDLQSKKLIEVCAIQWVRCIEKATRDLGDVDQDRVITLSYENIVLHPDESLDSIATFLGIDAAPYKLNNIKDRISHVNIGKGARSLNAAERQQIGVILKDVMDIYGYSDKPQYLTDNMGISDPPPTA